MHVRRLREPLLEEAEGALFVRATVAAADGGELRTEHGVANLRHRGFVAGKRSWSRYAVLGEFLRKVIKIDLIEDALAVVAGNDGEIVLEECGALRMESVNVVMDRHKRLSLGEIDVAGAAEGLNDRVERTDDGSREVRGRELIESRLVKVFVDGHNANAKAGTQIDVGDADRDAGDDVALGDAPGSGHMGILYPDVAVLLSQADLDESVLGKERWHGLEVTLKDEALILNGVLQSQTALDHVAGRGEGVELSALERQYGNVERSEELGESVLTKQYGSAIGEEA